MQDHLPDVIGHQADTDVFGHGKFRKGAWHLIGAADPMPDASGRGKRGDLLSIQLDGAGGLPVFAHDLAEHGGP